MSLIHPHTIGVGKVSDMYLLGCLRLSCGCLCVVYKCVIKKVSMEVIGLILGQLNL